MFANSYIRKQHLLPLIRQKPENDIGAIVVIPCFNEPDIIKTLISLNNCKITIQKVEVIVLINHSEITGREIKLYNQKTKIKIEKWISDNVNKVVQYFVLGPLELKKKWAGAGLARKKGMDEAARRFNTISKSDGIIISLDADTLVDENYFVEIENHFRYNPKDVGATISFTHQKEGLNQRHREGIVLYEKYMDYYKNALCYTGYPYPMFTVGSAFAVRADAYVKRGGMNRRQAGEDFYFLQNLALIGNVGEINSTRVYPSARISNRVPFGTGPLLQKWMNKEVDLTKTYNFEAFTDLKGFFDIKDRFFRMEESEFYQEISPLPESVNAFIKKDSFWKDLEDLNQNCSTLVTFRNRFFQKFNAFKILKFLNFAHENFYEKADLNDQMRLLNQHFV